MSSAKPIAYAGNAPYIFISYSHRDKEQVYPIIRGLQQRGMRVWYDEDLEGGEDWIKKVALRLEGCTQVICFISRNFLASRNCLNEIGMAAEENKGPILTSLEDVKLPADMRLHFNRINMLKRSNYSSLDEFVDKLALTDALRPCCSDRAKLTGQTKSQSTPAVQRTASVQKPSGKGKLIAAAAAAVALVALALVLILPKLGNSDSGGPASGSVEQQLPSDPEKRYELALNYIQDGSFHDAYTILKDLGDYADSADQMAAIREDAFLQQIRQAKAGDIVYWGSYEQDGVTSNGAEDIEWIVLYDDNGRKLLLSRKGLDCLPYHDNAGTTSWKASSLRQWLNDDFYSEAFTDAEQEQLYLPVLQTYGSEDTRDYVFLLSDEDVPLYSEYCKLAELTEYAVRQGASGGQWWLRSPGLIHNYAMDWAGLVYNDQPLVGKDKVENSSYAVRPSIWVDTRTEEELESEYTAALGLFEKENYKKALPAFTALGDYKDSQDYVKRLPQLILMKPYADAQVGDEVRIGSYDWIVLDKQEGKSLVISKYSIGDGDFVDAGWEITWDISGARTQLNNHFLNNLLQAGDEKSLILPTAVSTGSNPVYGTAGGADVTDQLFLLSYEEVMKYFPNAQDRLLTTESDKNTPVLWWLRTMGKDLTYAMYVDTYGNLPPEGFSTSPFSPTKLHLRPAMWIKTAE